MRPLRFSCANRTTNTPPNMYGTFMWSLSSGLVARLSGTSPIFRTTSGQAFDSVLHAFHVHPFAVSLEGDSQVNLPTYAILNHNHETVTRHGKLARQIGKAWVRRHNAQVRDIGALQVSLFVILWSGTVEQLKRRSAYSPDQSSRGQWRSRKGRRKRQSYARRSNASRLRSTE